MQASPSTPPTTLKQALVYAAVASVGAIFTGLFALLVAVLNRRKPKEDIHETQAREQRELATVRNLDANSAATAGEVLLKALKRLDDAEINAHDVRAELEGWKHKAADADALKAANAILERQLAEAGIQVRYWQNEAQKRR